MKTTARASLIARGIKVVFIKGIGGIGKTEIVKQYAKRNISDYDTIIFAICSDGLINLINAETPFAGFDQPLIELKCLIETKRVNKAKELAEYVVNLAKRIFDQKAKQLQIIQMIVSKL